MHFFSQKYIVVNSDFNNGNIMLDILIIEDCRDLSKDYREILDNLGLTSQIINDPSDIIALYQKKQITFKVLIMDLELNCGPLDGLTLYKFLALHFDRFIPVIISGNIKTSNMADLALECTSHLLKKPFNVESFTGLLKQCLKEYDEKFGSLK